MGRYSHHDHDDDENDENTELNTSHDSLLHPKRTSNRSNRSQRNPKRPAFSQNYDDNYDTDVTTNNDTALTIANPQSSSYHHVPQHHQHYDSNEQQQQQPPPIGTVLLSSLANNLQPHRPLGFRMKVQHDENGQQELIGTFLYAEKDQQPADDDSIYNTACQSPSWKRQFCFIVLVFGIIAMMTQMALLYNDFSPPGPPPSNDNNNIMTSKSNNHRSFYHADTTMNNNNIVPLSWNEYIQTHSSNLVSSVRALFVRTPLFVGKWVLKLAYDEIRNNPNNHSYKLVLSNCLSQLQEWYETIKMQQEQTRKTTSQCALQFPMYPDPQSIVQEIIFGQDIAIELLVEHVTSWWHDSPDQNGRRRPLVLFAAGDIHTGKRSLIQAFAKHVLFRHCYERRSINGLATNQYGVLEIKGEEWNIEQQCKLVVQESTTTKTKNYQNKNVQQSLQNECSSSLDNLKEQLYNVIADHVESYNGGGTVIIVSELHLMDTALATWFLHEISSASIQPIGQQKQAQTQYRQQQRSEDSPTPMIRPKLRDICHNTIISLSSSRIGVRKIFKAITLMGTISTPMLPTLFSQLEESFLEYYDSITTTKTTTSMDPGNVINKIIDGFLPFEPLRRTTLIPILRKQIETISATFQNERWESLQITDVAVNAFLQSVSIYTLQMKKTNTKNIENNALSYSDNVYDQQDNEQQEKVVFATLGAGDVADVDDETWQNKYNHDDEKDRSTSRIMKKIRTHLFRCLPPSPPAASKYNFASTVVVIDYDTETSGGVIRWCPASFDYEERQNEQVYNKNDGSQLNNNIFHDCTVGCRFNIY